MFLHSEERNLDGDFYEMKGLYSSSFVLRSVLGDRYFIHEFLEGIQENRLSRRCADKTR